MKASPSDSPEPLQNQLLAALPEAEWERWSRHLEPVDLPLGQVLCESGSTHDYAYFPTTAIVSLVYLTQDGASAEVAVVGNDGVVGISLFMGGNATLNQAMVQSAGRGYRMRAQVVKEEALRPGPAFDVLLRYALAMLMVEAAKAKIVETHTTDDGRQRLLIWTVAGESFSIVKPLVEDVLLEQMMAIVRGVVAEDDEGEDND